MEPTENQSFEESWRRAFDEASQPPDEALWPRIERQLPRRDRRPVGWVWWAAASLLALLLAGGLGWWAGHTGQPGAQTAGVARSPKLETAPAQAASSPGVSAQPSVGKDRETDGSRGFTGLSSKRKSALENRAVLPKAEPRQRVARRFLQKTNAATENQPRLAVTTFQENTSQRVTPPSEIAPDAAESNFSTVNSVVNSPGSQFVTPDFLAGKSVHPFRITLHVGMPVLVAKAVLPPPVGVPRPSRFYASLGASPVGFNPQVRLENSLVSAVASNNSFTATQLGYSTDASASSTAGLSYRVGGRVGWRVSRRWVLESGLEYLHGQGVIQNGLVLLDRSTSTASSLYANALGKNNAADLAALGTQNVFVPRTYRLRSTYQYLSVPVQAGYRLWPEKRLEGLLFAGFSGSFFLQNTLESISDPSLATQRYAPSDGVYTPLLWSGAAGLGLRYRLSGHWGAGPRWFLPAGTPLRGAGGAGCAEFPA